MAVKQELGNEHNKFRLFPSSRLGTHPLQAPACHPVGKLELQRPHSQAGAWERAKGTETQSKLPYVAPLRALRETSLPSQGAWRCCHII